MIKNEVMRMIYVGKLNDYRILHEQWDEKWAIVRSYKHASSAFKQVAILSPSTELFYMYRGMVNNGTWNKESFEQSYVPNFLKQMHGQNEVKMLNMLFNMSKTKKIALACFCDDEDKCHRSIIAGLLSGAGANVQTSSGNDYSKYWTMYNNPECWQNATIE